MIANTNEASAPILSANNPQNYLFVKDYKKATQANFSKAAQQYNQHANVQRQAAHDLYALMHFKSKNKPLVCVDLGAGPLVNTHFLQNKFAYVIAIDLSLSMLQSCNTNAPRLCADMDKLPLQASSVDVVFSNFALQWSENINRVFSSLYTALKPQGEAFISVVVEGSLNEIKTAFSALDNHNHVNTFNNEKNVLMAAKQAGFNIKSAHKHIYTDTFKTPLAAIKSIKAIGATSHTHQNTRQGLLTRSALKKVCNAYPVINNKASVSYHVVLMSLEKI